MTKPASGNRQLCIRSFEMFVSSLHRDIKGQKCGRALGICVEMIIDDLAEPFYNPHRFDVRES